MTMDSLPVDPQEYMNYLEVIVAPWNSNRIRRSKRSLPRGLVLSPIRCLQSESVIKS